MSRQSALYGALLISICLARPVAAAEPKAPEAPPAAGQDAKPPETIPLNKTAKLAPVKFAHAKHAEKLGCKACHEGEPALFEQKAAGAGMKMADMYAGKACGACHDGKKAFAAKGGCMKCHKK